MFNRLAKRQVNRLHDVKVVDEGEASVTIYIAYPGLYLTYDRTGKLIESASPKEWEAKGNRPAVAPVRQLVFAGTLKPLPVMPDDDDDVPF